MAIVTKNGQAFTKNGKPLQKYKSNCGYLRVFHKGRKVSLHRLVAETFIPNPEQKPCVNHKDGNKENNHVENLEWVTYSENGKHAFKIGLMGYIDSNKNGRISGEGNGRAKLTQNDVDWIRANHQYRKRGEKVWFSFGISQQMYNNIVAGRNWL